MTLKLNPKGLAKVDTLPPEQKKQAQDLIKMRARIELAKQRISRDLGEKG